MGAVKNKIVRKSLCPILFLSSLLAFYHMVQPAERSASYNQWVRKAVKSKWIEARIEPDNIILNTEALKSMLMNAVPYRLAHDRTLKERILIIQRENDQLSVECITFKNNPQSLVIDVPEIGYYIVSDHVDFLLDND